MFSLRPSTIWLRSCLMACRLVSVSKRTWYGGRYMVRKVRHIICFVCFGVLHPTREFFTPMVRSPLPVKGSKFLFKLGTNGLWAMAFFLLATPTVTMDICLFNIFEQVFSLCHKWNKYNCKPYQMLNHVSPAGYSYVTQETVITPSCVFVLLI